LIRIGGLKLIGASSTQVASRGIYYGWIVVAATWLIYGMAISPTYYSWGFFAPAVAAELGLNRGFLGAVHTLYQFIYRIISPAIAYALNRFGARATITCGLCITAIGAMLTSQVSTQTGFLLTFSLVTAIGVGFSSILPAQVLGSNWFIRHRATAIALILTAGGIHGKVILKIDDFILDRWDWRAGWIVIAGITLVSALIGALLIRNKPEDLGLRPDGAGGTPENTAGSPSPLSELDHQWTGTLAMRTQQFALTTFCAVAYSFPWGILVAHMPSHLLDVGFEREFAAAAVGTMALVSIAGRLAGMLGDYMAPQRVMALSLLIEGVGLGGLLLVPTTAVIYGSLILIGVGFGMAYISVPVVFSAFFGRVAFATTSGMRLMIMAFFSSPGPWLAGRVFDRTQSYEAVFWGCLVLVLGGAWVAWLIRPPDAPS
jgi:cyanate permease